MARTVIDDPRAVHIVGIGGAGTSGLAGILAARGVRVSGSDQNESPVVERLRRAGATICVPHAEEHLSCPETQVDVVVHSAAVPPTNKELGIARARGIPVAKYAGFLGRIFNQKRGLAVAGTHGKTTTAGMLASILVAAGRDPSVLIGGEHPGLGGNWRAGTGDEFVAEACEFDRSFHELGAASGIITNVELDHPDIYPSEKEIVDSFAVFVSRFRPGAVLVTNAESPLLEGIARKGLLENLRHFRFGFGSDCDWRAEMRDGGARPRFAVTTRGRGWGEVRLGVPGRHSVANALAALTLAIELGVPRGAILAALAEFPGIARRFERHPAVAGIDLVDDYAHHPTELERTLDTAREVYPGRSLWAVFQPHQYVRLHAFGSGFARALARADHVLLLPAYSVRESAGRDACELDRRLEADVRAAGTEVRLSSTLREGLDILSAELRSGDVCLSIGAGDIFRLTPQLRRELVAREAGVGAGAGAHP